MTIADVDIHTQNFEAAVAGDDPYPDEVCPGCLQDIAGWQRWGAHRRADGLSLSTDAVYSRNHRNAPPPFVAVRLNMETECEWDRDALAARAHGRRLIQEHLQRVSS